MIVVTGGAGCIGSAVVWALNKRGITDIILVDEASHPEKEKNIASLDYYALENKDVFLSHVINSNMPWSVDAIIHMGGCSSTIERDKSFLPRITMTTPSCWQLMLLIQIFGLSMLLVLLLMVVGQTVFLMRWILEL